MTTTKTKGKTYDVSPHWLVTVNADQEFYVFALQAGQVVALLGPDQSTNRKFQFKTDSSFDQVEVTCKGRHFFEVVPLPNPQEVANPIPTEAVVDRPLTLKEEMRLYIDQHLDEIRSMHQGEAETFEESLDFDVDDDEMPSSPYEFTDMDEEYLLSETSSLGEPADNPESSDQEQSPALLESDESGREAPDNPPRDNTSPPN